MINKIIVFDDQCTVPLKLSVRDQCQQNIHVSLLLLPISSQLDDILSDAVMR